MFSLLHLYLIFSFLRSSLSETIRLPQIYSTNSSSTSLYLCHVHPLNNTEERFLENYEILHGGQASHVHHLLLYECSTRERLAYSGFCGKDNARLMPELVYRHCQTRIIIAWAKGGQLKTIYPSQTGLKLDISTQFLLEVHFEPSIPLSHSIGIHLGFSPRNIPPQYEIGVLTLGTLAKSPLYLPPLLDSIAFPTYCVNDCWKDFLGEKNSIKIFSILVHAHRYARRIILEDNYFHRLIDRNPFEYHRQENLDFTPPYPQINSTHELSLICYYSTRNLSSHAIYGGYHSEDEMCQAFLYYYPRIPSFPLCLSLPIYNHRYTITNWSREDSVLIKKQLESNRNHLSMCGDNLVINQTNETRLRKQIYQRSMRNLEQYPLISFHSSWSFYTLILFPLIFFFLWRKLLTCVF